MKSIVIIPCFNEQKRLIGDHFLNFLDQHKEMNFLFVNDGSSDDTLKILKEMSSKSEKINFLDLKKNSGKAQAIREGMLHAYQAETNYDFFAFYDADQATPLYELKRLIDLAITNDTEALLATRFKHLGANVQRKMYRHYFGRIVATVISMMLNLPVYDTQCGTKIFKREVIPTCFQNKFKSKWFFDVECLFRLKSLGHFPQLKINEIPLKEWRDVGGSKLTLFDFFSVPYELVKLFFIYIFLKRVK